MNHHFTTPPVWVLLDETPGHANQALGVAEALGLPFIRKPMQYNALAALPPQLLGRTAFSLTTMARQNLTPPWPEILIACGRRTVPIARWIKRQAQKQYEPCFMVQLMWPGSAFADYDLIAMPQHDADKQLTRDDRLLLTLGAPHRLTSQTLYEATRRWKDTLPEPTRRRIAVMLGGDAKNIRYRADHWRQLASALRTLATALEGELLITTSRRTDARVMPLLEAALHDTPRQWLPFATAAEHNPYPAILGLCEVSVVTGDSVSMASEACSTGKPVFLFTPDGIYPRKHHQFHRQLLAGGYAHTLPTQPDAKALTRLLAEAAQKRIPTLHVAKYIAQMIQSRTGGR